ncbi:hypothetical protein [Amycolatopsis anabasis]|uniref:hypothetical protein n=1 Tax=Amycolatopsis anabasis TaxID=1840409 RepID=UPI00131CB8DF|nr:hypothetical protein [Amycolatopsis anabasis]
MSRRPRGRQTEQAAIRAAADRLLAGNPLHSTTGKLTTTELITESGLRRDVVYEHRDLVDEFKAHVKAQNSTPVAMRQLADDYTAAKEELATLKEDLSNERAATALLRRVVAELSLELEQARDELTHAHQIARLPTHQHE